MNAKDWKFGRMLKQSMLDFNEGQLLRIMDGLGDRGMWNHALSVVEWAYQDNDRKQLKSRYKITSLYTNTLQFNLKKSHLEVRIGIDIGLCIQSF